MLRLQFRQRHLNTFLVFLIIKANIDKLHNFERVISTDSSFFSLKHKQFYKTRDIEHTLLNVYKGPSSEVTTLKISPSIL